LVSSHIVLAMHGSPPRDFPRREMAEYFGLRSRLGHAAGDDPSKPRYEELERKMRDWPRTPENDPYFTASQEMAAQLSRATGNPVTVGFNEFCAPTLDAALDRAAGDGADTVIVVTPMMTRGGEHSETEIPEEVEQARKRHPGTRFVYVWPFESADVAGFLAAQIRQFMSGRD
jgi:sirohydrochlorin cobaltochelatase